MTRTLQMAWTAAAGLAVGLFASGSPASAQTATGRARAPRFHHVHLNATDPAAAAAWYLTPFGQSSTRTMLNGYEAVKTGDLYLLFSKAQVPPLSELNAPQSAVWHFGWNTPDSRGYNDRFRAQHLEIAQMWDSRDGRRVDMSSDSLELGGLPNAFMTTERFPTQEQVLELRNKGAQPSYKAGFGYLRGPDRALIENAQSGQTERFNHVHLYHEHPQCAVIWYVTYLDASLPDGAALPSSASCRRAYSPPTYPSFARSGFVREPRGDVRFGDISISIVPWPGGGLVSTRGYVVDHWAVTVSDLDASIARMKTAGVKVLEDVHAWGATRAAMVEGPDRMAIELVEDE